MPIALVMSSSQTLEASSTSNGARMVSIDGRELPLLGAHVRAEAGGGIARTVLEQRFRNAHAEALTVTYSLPLPADGAVCGFAFVLGGRRIQGEVQKRADARATFEQAILEGRSAALLEQDRSSLFTQEIGNIPPGATVVCEITVDQPLVWLSEGAWEWRFPTVVAPRYMGASDRVPDAARIQQEVAEGPITARFTLSCAIRDELPAGRRPESPSHPVTVHAPREAHSYRQSARAAETGARAADTLDPANASTPSEDFGPTTTVRVDDGARLDRDIVVRWPVATPRVGLSLQVGRPATHLGHAMYGYGLLTLVPPLREAAGAPVGRDLTVLLDTSGSMGGEPLAQARRIVGALVDTLGDGDRLEMIEFSSRARRWRSAPVPATRESKGEALAWLNKLSAGGSTEMRDGILEALAPLRSDAQKQVVVVTDGQIGFETEVIAAICDRLPVSSRLHMVGVGSAVNRSLTGPASRAGRGVEVVVGLGEDPERAAKRLVAATDRPIVVDLRIEGSAVLDHAPRRLPDLFAGAPVLVGLSLRPEGGEILVHGRTAQGAWEQRLSVGPILAQSGSAMAVSLFGRQSIEDCELALAAGSGKVAIDRTIERLGLDFQLATRLTSWVAVTKQVTVDPEGPRRKERMPHELAHGVSAEGVGLRGPDGLAPFDGPLAGPVGPLRRTEVASRSIQDSIVSAPYGGPMGLPKSRRVSLGPWSLLAILAFAITYYFTRSFWIALGVSWMVMVLVLVVQRLFR